MAAALVFAAASCGGGGGGTTTTTSTDAAGSSATVHWASGVCTAFTDWKTSLESIRTSLRGSHSKADLQHAGSQVTDATETLANTLQQLGRPETTSGQAAQKNLDVLTTELKQDKAKIEDTLKTTTDSSAAESLAALSTVSGTLAKMAHNLTLALGHLKSYDPSGELEQAFHEAQSCSPYFTS